ncbi:Uncharacterised protein [Serratia ficaria]|uniref:hypothetical protein n=1 Tax=Serratia ficaria TaxID=61651 RepID=UPI0021770F9D|nr:hypothetical protein [Serratia ficaria]CAI1107637.1 Uncharacterised protein [Serratia ficaria]CAI1810366.1 Uncharacterised protein [Serratia ficaria]CAI2489836.1 Uncharacterised protein [Serratia ficaria]CAI2791707.1 Uncharacterised protein [Serratia ficaria]
MTHITETANWAPGIYQIQRGDAVTGGRDGIANVQATQLAARTRYLKQAIDGVQAGDVPYSTDADAKAAIDAGKLPPGALFSVRTDEPGVWVYECRNVNGDVVPTGKKLYAADMVDYLVERVSTLNDTIQPTDASLLEAVSANGIRPFRIRNSDGALEFEMIIRLLTGDAGMQFGGSLLDNFAPPGWKFLIQGANGLIIAGVKDDGTKVGFGDGAQGGQAGAVTPGDTAAGYDDIRNYTGEATTRDVIGARIGGRFVVYPGVTDADDGGGVLVGVDGRRWVRLADHVSYDMFGAPRIPDDVYQRYVALSKAGEETAAQALLDNVEPADDAIARCHEFANKYGLPVVQNSGAFLWVGAEWVVRTPCRLTGCTVVTCNRSGTEQARWGTVDGVSDGAPQPMYMYRIQGKDRIEFSAAELAELNANYSAYLKKGSTQLPMPLLHQYRGGMVTLISSAVELYRNGGRTNPRLEVHYRDFARIGKNGALSDALVKNIPDGSVIEAFITQKEDAWLTFNPPSFFEAGSGRKFVNVQIERAMVNIDDLVMHNCATGNLESRVAIGSYGVFDLRMKNAAAECTPSTSGSYVVCFRNSIEIHVTGYYGLYGWGFQGHHGAKRLFIDKSSMNRFDFHSFGYDVAITRTQIKGRQFNLQGGGKYTLSDITYIVTSYNVDPSQPMEYRLDYMVNMREDYASDCECDLTIRDVVVRFDRNIDKAWSKSVLSFDVVRLNWGSAENYGVDTKTPPTIVGENIVFDLEGSPESLPDNFAFTFCRAFRSRCSNYNLTYLPDLVSVKNMTAINVPADKNALMAVFRTDGHLALSPKSSRNQLRADGTNARIIGEGLFGIVNNPVIEDNACPTVYLPGDTSQWDTAVNGTTYRESKSAWVPKVMLINCDPIIINATGARAMFDIHGGLLARFKVGETANRCRVTGADIQLYPDAAGATYFDSDNVRAANCDWLDPANGATYAGRLNGVGNVNIGTKEHSPNI